MILIEDLKVSYDKKILFNGLTLELNNKNVHGIIGLNGAGKTTLLNTIFGLKKPDKGKIYFDNELLSKKYIGYLETENYFYPYLTGKEYLSLFDNPLFDISLWNKLFKLPLDELIENYSTGMKKKLALLGVLKMDRPVIMLDEPFNGLDLEAGELLKRIILKLKESGKTIIITSHIIDIFPEICDYIHYIFDGNIETFNIEDFDLVKNKISAYIEEGSLEQIDRLFTTIK